MSIKIITIDFWNTLFDSTGGSERNIYRINFLLDKIKSFHSELEYKEFDDAMTASWKYFNDIWLNEQRTPSTIETVEFFWDYLKLPYNEEIIEEVAVGFAECVLHHPPNLIPYVKEALEILSKEFKIGLVSDTGFSPGTILKKLMHGAGILPYFNAFSFSDETGVSKPHPKAYLYILDQFNCQPENAVHVGDIEKTDIAGAKRIGMKAIRFSGDPTAKLNSDNPTKSLADFEAHSWQEVINYVRKM